MSVDLDDTIVALASASGIGARAIIRLSGPDSLRVAQKLFRSTAAINDSSRQLYSGAIRLPGIHSELSADLIFWPAPHSYTGQQMVEIHAASAPPLIDLLIAELLNAGSRAATPGEFTLRAFLAGKRDLPRAEAVQAVVSAGNRDELQQALTQLAGGVTRPLEGLREDLLNLLADIEAGLDFAEEDIQFAQQREILLRLTAGMAKITTLKRHLEQRSLAERPFRAVLVGEPNAGKSSLFNALAGAAALVSPIPGTTRDYLLKRLDLDGVTVELADTAGWQSSQNEIDHQAQELGRNLAHEADLLLLCVEAGRELTTAERGRLQRSEPPIIGVATKCDLGPPAKGFQATSATLGSGLAELKRLLRERAQARKAPPLAPSLSRCRHHVDACLDHLRRAHGVALYEDPPEILALELRGALDQLGAMVGAIYTDDLLDRVFSRFCIGK